MQHPPSPIPYHAVIRATPAPMHGIGALQISEDPMPQPAPSFPAFEDWKNMSEREQDALLDRLEAAKQRGVRTTRLLLGIGFAIVALATVVVLFTLG